ncbi:ArsR family transcriptional regulator [Actinomadura sp. NBRC 104425]|uniref:winged helix-turn-helix transcriptional regulator n=1 Tax=Actinomadura sp. NBRC 104425 TaxID=3032204 RepID=UPI0024A233DF|nr:helix-turn-helix domain-containing protein [Actinomadura sp. NBRC 104425]GLZ11762.1 ArsR family transcriptional regulator [Actinomadura sp. NBRC 104425]
MALGKDYARQDCAVARALEVVGERWTMLIIRDALYGVRRFSDFLARLDIPRAVLSQRLQSLVDAGVLEKAGHEYAITETGKELWPVVHALARWGERHFGDRAPVRLYCHAGCGARLAADGTCPECARPVPLEEVELRPGPGAPVRDDPVSVALREPHRMLTPVRT